MQAGIFKSLHLWCFCTAGQLSTELGFQIADLTIYAPVPLSDSDAWAFYVDPNDGNANNGQSITTASSMAFHVTPVPGEAGSQFTTQPIIKVMDSSVSKHSFSSKYMHHENAWASTHPTASWPLCHHSPPKVSQTIDLCSDKHSSCSLHTMVWRPTMMSHKDM